jgi:membrane protein implicated in regulation of membrane protease activity
MSTPVIWLLVAAALALAEIVTESLFLAPLVAAAVVMAAGALIGAPFGLVVVVAIAGAAITLLMLRPLMHAYLNGAGALHLRSQHVQWAD